MTSTITTPHFPAIEPTQPVKTGNSNWMHFTAEEGDPVISGLPSTYVVKSTALALETYNQAEKTWQSTDIPDAVQCILCSFI